MPTSKVILFGSFTEDEIKSFQNKPSEKIEVPVHKAEYQFGSLPLVAKEVYSGGSSETGKIHVSSVISENSVKKDADSLAEKDILQSSEKVSKENGTVHGTGTSSSQGNGVLSKPLPNSPHLSKDTRAKMTYSNGVHKETRMFVPTKYVGENVANGAINATRELLPRGLINAGNLCFLNATLQVDYPTLIAFVDFLTEFDMPPCSSSKKKNPTTIETGRPFRPAMFEDVVKNFTPDVPSGFSGRIRNFRYISFSMHIGEMMQNTISGEQTGLP